jgi:tetratricopeptide (TPR) repeat protein
MRPLRIFLRRLHALFGKGGLDATLDEEVRFHLEMEAERLVQRGMSPDEAGLAARRRFGGVEQIKETYRDQRGLPGVETFARDLAHAARTLCRHPGYTIVAVLSLALGIGANTAVFSLIDAYVLRPLPYPEPERLVRIYMAGRLGGRFTWGGAVSAPVVRDWRERSHAFTAIGAFLPGNVNLQGSDGALRVPATFAEPEVFQALGVPPLHGRFVLPENTTPGLDRVVVLGHALWMDRFGGSKDAIGQTIRINASDHTIVGVMPAGFEFPPRASAALWVPLPMPPAGSQDRGNNFLSVVARVKPGVSLSAARGDMTNVSRQLEAMYPNSHVAWLLPLHGDTVGRTALVLVVLAATVGFVLLLACANVAHMVLARAMARRHEFAVRLALGASRWRIMRLLLAEGFLLALAGGLVGLAACRWAIDALLSLPANPLPAGIEVSISWPVLAYCALGSTLTALGISMVPAWRLSRQHLQADLAEVVASARSRARHGNRLITIEVALSVLLVIGAGMLVRSLRSLTDLDFGFRPENILTMRVSMAPGRYPDVPRLHAFYDRLLERLSAVAWYHYNVTGEEGRAVEALELLKRTYPQRAVFRRSLNDVHLWAGRFDAALTESLEAQRLEPNSVMNLIAVSRAYLYLNRLADARATAEKAIALGGTSRWLHLILFQCALATSDLELLARERVWAAEHPDLAMPLIVESEAEESVNHGRLQEALGLLRQYETWATASEAPLTAMMVRLRMARFEALVGLRARALRRVDEEIRRGLAPGLKIDAVKVAISAGAFDLAARLLDEIEQGGLAVGVQPDATFVRAYRAAVDASRGRIDDALSRLAPLEPLDLGLAYGFIPLFERAQTHFLAGNWAMARAAYEKILAHSTLDSGRKLLPLAQLGLARTLARAGDIASSRRTYEQFFERWKTADPDLPLLAQARREYQALPI